MLMQGTCYNISLYYFPSYIFPRQSTCRPAISRLRFSRTPVSGRQVHPRKVDGQRRVFLDVPLDAPVLLVFVQADRLALTGGDFDFAKNLFLGVEILERALLGQDDRNVEPVFDV